MDRIESKRFDYLKYDEKAMCDQLEFKRLFMEMESSVEVVLRSPRHKALIMTYLEIAYMWIGKAIRDDQVTRNGIAELQEERSKE